MGVVERSLVGATLWCTNLLFGPDGRLLSRHRKIQPTAAERIVWSQGQGSNACGYPDPSSVKSGAQEDDRRMDNMPVIDTALGKIGGLICWESERFGRLDDSN